MYMRLLLIANLLINDIISGNNCKTRSQYNAYLVYKYLTETNFENLEIIYRACCPQGKCHNKNSSHNEIPIVDHILFVEDRCLFKRSKQYLEKLKKSCKGMICLITQHNKNFSGEDMLFYFTPSYIPNTNSYLLNPLIDTTICTPKKDEFVLKILFENKYSFINTLVNGLSTINTHKNIIIVRKDGHNFETYIYDKKNKNITLSYQKLAITYTDILNEYCTTDIYIATTQENEYKLYELGACNTLIIANNNLLNNKLVNKLNILTYDIKDNIPWNKIIVTLDDFNLRDKLQDISYNIELDKVYTFLREHTVLTKQTIIEKTDHRNNDKHKMYKGPPFYTFLKNVLRTRPDKQIEQPQKKRSNILLQSDLLQT